MRAPQDLLELPYVFTQLPVMTGDEFLKQTEVRGLRGSVDLLQALHRLGLLVPFLRVRRDGRAVAAIARRNDGWSRSAGHDRPTSRPELQEAHARGGLHDPTAERFMSRTQMARSAYGVEYQSSEYLYSHHQLLTIPTLRQLMPFLRFDSPDARNATIEPLAFRDLVLRPRLRFLASLNVALHALDAYYYPEIVWAFVGNMQNIREWEAWRSKFGPVKLLKWLDVEPSWIKESAAELLHLADGLDPLGEWSTVLREASPRTWWHLKGDARSALDKRIAAELLLQHYEALARAHRAPKLPQRIGMERTQFETRLKSGANLDSVLTRFGLSPHPSLILIVEGETEELIFHRLIEHFGVRSDPQFIAIVNRKGVGIEIAPLLAYAITPHAKPDVQAGNVLASRPITQVLIATDPEKPMKTMAAREARRQTWIDRIRDALPRDQRTPTVREALTTLVHIDIWRGEQSFEYANFTDLQLARAIASLDSRDRQPSLQERRAVIAGLRAKNANLKKGALWPGVSKVALAEALWPTLRQRVETARRHGTHHRIAVIRILDHAVDLASGTHRGQVLLRL